MTEELKDALIRFFESAPAKMVTLTGLLNNHLSNINVVNDADEKHLLIDSFSAILKVEQEILQCVNRLTDDVKACHEQDVVLKQIKDSLS